MGEDERVGMYTQAFADDQVWSEKIGQGDKEKVVASMGSSQRVKEKGPDGLQLNKNKSNVYRDVGQDQTSGRQVGSGQIKRDYMQNTSSMAHFRGIWCC